MGIIVSLRPCLHGGGITFYKVYPSKRVITLHFFFLFPLHEGGITLG